MNGSTCGAWNAIIQEFFLVAGNRDFGEAPLARLGILLQSGLLVQLRTDELRPDRLGQRRQRGAGRPLELGIRQLGHHALDGREGLLLA
jgi:hypothetical protein